LTEEEDCLSLYLKEMAEMGFGLSRETVMCLAFKIVDAAQQKHPFKDQKQAGLGLMVSVAGIPSYLYIPLYPYLIAMHSMLIQEHKRFFWKAWCHLWTIEPHM